MNVIVCIQTYTDAVLRAQYVHSSKCGGQLSVHDVRCISLVATVTLACDRCAEMKSVVTHESESPGSLVTALYMGTLAGGRLKKPLNQGFFLIIRWPCFATIGNWICHQLKNIY